MERARGHAEAEIWCTGKGVPFDPTCLIFLKVNTCVCNQPKSSRTKADWSILATDPSIDANATTSWVLRNLLPRRRILSVPSVNLPSDSSFRFDSKCPLKLRMSLFGTSHVTEPDDQNNARLYSRTFSIWSMQTSNANAKRQRTPLRIEISSREPLGQTSWISFFEFRTLLFGLYCTHEHT